MPKSTRTKAYDRFRLLLVAERMGAGLSQAEVAGRLRKPQSFVSKFERGERRLDVIEFREVARAIGIEPLRFLRKVYGPLDGSK